MDLVELADRVNTSDVVIGLAVGIVVWILVNYIGLREIARRLNTDIQEAEPRWTLASAQAGLRLLATLTGIVVGGLTVWLMAS